MGDGTVKKCEKLPEPQALSTYRQARPNDTWDKMKDDPLCGGQSAYSDVKRALVKSQRCLCAFCETRIADGMMDADFDAKKHEQRVEHFHPKNDTSRPPNWALHWQNMWAVCLGGSRQDTNQQEHVIYPLPENLSCDAYKDRQITTGKLSPCPEGWVLRPDEIPAFPLLFQYAPDGMPEPHHKNCAMVIIQGNQYPDTITLVAKTIEHLNLGCSRLNRRRCIVKNQLEKEIERERKKNPGVPSLTILTQIARKQFSSNVTSPWPEFFSLIRWRLGTVAEQHLASINFSG
jgi:uncharacterized protein (TIGR02646 family)